jgi:hypothetical protein
MRKISQFAFLFCLFGLPFTSLQAQSVITENFSDGNFSQNPVWQGDTAQFTVNQQRLQLNDTTAGSAYLSTPANLVNNAVWTITFAFDFNPSGSNYARFYLMSDQANLSGGLNGYYLRLGGSSADKVSLYRQTGGTSRLVCESPADWLDLDPVQATVQVSRSAAGFWRLQADTGAGLTALDSALDATHSFSTHLGWQAHYTITRADKFFLDSLRVTGAPLLDTLAPRLDSLQVVAANSLQLLFNEPLTPATAEAETNYRVNQGLGAPALAVQDAQDARRVTLSFIDSFANKQLYQLTFSGLADRFGNLAQDSATFRYVVPQPGDVVFNEIMYDPNPVVGLPPNALPEREYLELLNRSQVPINLANFRLQIGSVTLNLPSYLLPPAQVVVLTKDEGVNEFDPNLPVLGLKMSSVALTNSGTDLVLLSPQGQVLSSLSYRPTWFTDPNKAQGGWSLEQIDPANLCGGAGNWRGSESLNGGTPGLPNSVLGTNPDTVAPTFTRMALPGDSAALLLFSEALVTAGLENPQAYQITPPLGIDSVSVPLTRDRVLLHLSQALVPETLYRLSLNVWPADCSGNTMPPDTLRFGLPAEAEAGDVVLNEVLFNPRPDGADFVEIYNASEKIMDLQHLRLGNYNAGTQAPQDLRPLSEESYLLYPGQHLALSEGPAAVLADYPQALDENLRMVPDLPSLPDAEGSLCLATAGLQIIDALVYHQDWHLAVLDNPEGVSLERLSYTAPTQDPNNWLSAAAAAGYATPGAVNSQRPGAAQAAQLSVQPPVFSPNQDGYRDFVTIAYDFPQGGQVIAVQIFTVKGQRLATLSANENTAASGFVTWAGETDQGTLAPRGAYIVLLEYFNAQGASGVLKETVVLSR